jgi:hypothetical protein
MDGPEPESGLRNENRNIGRHLPAKPGKPRSKGRLPAESLVCDPNHTLK